MDGLARTVGDGITGLVGGSLEFIGATLGGIVGAGQRALPGALFYVVIVAVVILVGWTLVKR
jgi:hypothetical protein